MSIATKVMGVVITSEASRGSLVILTTRCDDYDHFASLPDVVQYNGQIFGKTGWNSDSEKAYYRNDAKVALAAA